MFELIVICAVVVVLKKLFDAFIDWFGIYD